MRIKICGLRRPEDIAYVNEAKPDWCGFIVNFPRSHRSITPETLRALRKGLSPDILPVGVFVDQPVEVMADLLRDGTIAVAQLHGHEDAETIAALRQAVPGCVIWKAVKVRCEEDLRTAAACTADMVLLDNGYGTGQCFDWTLVSGFERPFLLAGGLTPENIPEAAAAMHPFGVDLSSSVETDKVKDRDKILAAVAAARGV